MKARAAVVALAATVLGLVVVVLPPLGATPASATHPCASQAPGSSPSPSPTPSPTPSPSGTPTPPDRYSHPACPNDPPAPTAADVTVNNTANGTTVHLTVGQRLGVQLTSPYDSAQTWSDVSAGGALYRTRLYVGGYQTDAVFQAISTSAGETVTGTTDALCRHEDTPCPTAATTWSVTVVVDQSPSSSASPEPCYAYPPSSPQPGAVVVQESDRGRTITVQQGDVVRVYLGGTCPAGGGYQPATSSGPLYREGVDEYQPGATYAGFRAVGTGTAAISATTDAPCLHASPGCAFPQTLWSVNVTIAPASCTVIGPSDVPAGDAVPLSGRAAPGAAVSLLFRRRGGSAFAVRRTLTAGPDGSFATLFTAYDDYRWYAATDSCTSAAGLTRAMPRVEGPATTHRGSTVALTVRGPAGATGALYLRAPGGAFALRRTGRFDETARWRTSYVAGTDERYYVVTGPDRRVSPPGLTQVR